MRNPQKIAPNMTASTTSKRKHTEFLIALDMPLSFVNQFTSSVMTLRLYGPLNLLRKILDQTGSQQFLMNSPSITRHSEMRIEQLIVKISAQRGVVMIYVLEENVCSITQRNMQGIKMLSKQEIIQLVLRISQAIFYPTQLRITLQSENREQTFHLSIRQSPSIPPLIAPLSLPYFQNQFSMGKISTPILERQLTLKVFFISMYANFVLSMFKKSERLPSLETTKGLQNITLSNLLKKVAPLEFLSGRLNSSKTVGQSHTLYPYLGKISLLISKYYLLFLMVWNSFSTPGLIFLRLYSNIYVFYCFVSLKCCLYFIQSQTIWSSSLQERKFQRALSLKSNSSTISVYFSYPYFTLKYLFKCFCLITLCLSDLNLELNFIGLSSRVVGSLRQKSMKVQSTSFFMRYLLATFSKLSVFILRKRQMSLSSASLPQRTKALTLNPQTF